MSNVLVNETSLQNIANAIREKNGLTDTYKPSEMASAISSIVSGGSSNKTIVRGEFTVASMGVKYSSYFRLIHNLGEIKPFRLYFEPITNEIPTGKASDIFAGEVFVPRLTSRTMIYSNGETTMEIQAKTVMMLHKLDGNSIGGNIAALNIVDEQPTTSPSNYTVRMWKDGFDFATYLGLNTGVTYRYVLIYGEDEDEVLS